MSDLIITRIFDAPRSAVYQAFVDPDQLAQWFGPVGWTVPRDTVDIDARTGGHQRFTMVSRDDPSQTSVVEATFLEVVEDRLIVGETGGMRLSVEFHDEEGGRTRLELTQGPYPDEFEAPAREGWSSSFTKLDKLLSRGR